MEIIQTNKEIIIKDDRLSLGKITLADIKHPFTIIYTSNYYEDIKHTALCNLQGAVCIKRWTRGNYIDDNYGRDYKVGTIKCSIWDLRDVFGIKEPLEDFLDYETKAFLKGETNTLF